MVSFPVDDKAFGQDGYGAKASNVLMQVERYVLLIRLLFKRCSISGSRKRF